MELWEQYDKIYRYCYFRLHDRYLAEDITQETLLRFLENDSYKDYGRPLAYLYTIAHNLCIDAFRAHPVWQLDESLPAAGFEDTAIDRLALHDALKTLTKKEQDLLLLRYVNEVPLADLSRLYKKSRFALYRELNRITQKLKRRLTDG